MFKRLLYPFVLMSCIPSNNSSTTAEESVPSLKELASNKGIVFGTSIDEKAYLVDDQYRTELARQFSIVTPDYSPMMDALRFLPGDEHFNFSTVDKVMDFAKENSILVRGHALQWYFSNPKWLTWKIYTASELEALLKNHIETVVTHFKEKYPGVLPTWVVVNEAVDEYGQPRRGIWSQIGNEPWDYIVKAFFWANQADPQLKLFYNDYDMEKGGVKAENIFKLVKSMKENNVPIHGIGYQMHVDLDHPFDPVELETQFNKYADLGLEIHITEMDVRIKTDDGVTEDELARQAKVFESALRVCLKVSACKNFTLWGFTDRHSWINGGLFYPGYGAATPMDENLQPKPAFNAMVELLQQEEP